MLDAMKTAGESWLPPLGKLSLSDNDVHVWIAAVDTSSNCVREFMKLLSGDETRRAESYYFERDRRRFVIGRGLLRRILGRYYLDIEPRRLEFRKGPRGKPYLAESFDNSKIRFNLTASQGLAVFAFAKDHEVGIDVEYMRYMADAQQIVEGSFSKAEAAAFNELLDQEKQEAFFSCWTRKEAFVKAIGEGLYFPLDQFDVSLRPGEPARVLRVAGKPKEAVQWYLKSFRPEKGYKAALAVKCTDCKVTFWRCPGLGDWCQW